MSLLQAANLMGSIQELLAKMVSRLKIFFHELFLKFFLAPMISKSTRKLYNEIAESLPEAERDDPSKWIDEFMNGAFRDPKIQYMTRDGISYAIPPPFNPKVLNWSWDNWTPKANDVIVATFPKTGTTWVREICRQLKNLGKSEEQEKITKLMFDPSYAYMEGTAEFTRKLHDKVPVDGRVFATHVRSDLLNMESLKASGAKVIYVMRNPKDMVISYEKFMHSLPFNQHGTMAEIYPKDFNKFLTTLVQGKHPLCLRDGEWYPHHIQSWMKYKDEDFFHYVFYEDIIEDPTREIKKIADHLNANASEEEIATIVHKVSFKEMKKQKESENDLYKISNFFRAGGVGKWKSILTVDQSELIDRAFNHDMQELELDLPFKYTLDR